MREVAIALPRKRAGLATLAGTVHSSQEHRLLLSEPANYIPFPKLQSVEGWTYKYLINMGNSGG
jgi:hypothetical protein